MAKKIIMSGVIGWDITADSVRVALAAAKGEDVIFHASGPGGLVYEGIEIYNTIREYSGNTEMIITGIAASMMSYIALSVDKVMAYDNATFMIHNPWDFSIGDYNVMQESSDYLKGLTGLLSKAYISKTGKSVASMKALMDKDSYFFGDEMLTEGFVDEIIEAPETSDNNDKGMAITAARASIESCVSKMRDSEAANADRGRAVAYFDGMSALMDAPKPAVMKNAKPAASGGSDITPAGAGINKQEVKHMSLEVLLADPANASAKAEFDIAIGKARTEGKTAAKDEMKAVIASISPKLTSDAYGPDVKEAGIKAITGEGHISTFETLAVIADRDIEKLKAEAAKAALADGGDGNGGPDTPGQSAGSDTAAEAEAALEAKMARCGIATEGGK